jgi:hypothetical protein
MGRAIEFSHGVRGIERNPVLEFKCDRSFPMGQMAYALRMIAGLAMALSVIAVFASFSDAMANLGRPDGGQTLGVMFLVAFACFLIVFLSAGVLWVLTDISQRLHRPAQAQTPHSAELRRHAS